MKPDVLVFDMDGVLVDVHLSYREAIRATVQHFVGVDLTPDEIQGYKNRGGFNNDWVLCHVACRERGVEVAYDDIVREFQRVFWGDSGTPGLVQHERWLPEPGLLEGLAERYPLAILTGRDRAEANYTLQRFAPVIRFDPVVVDDGTVRPKPAPDGLELIKQRYPQRLLWYVGDTVDDARCASAAGVPFVHVLPPSQPLTDELYGLIIREEPLAMAGDINDMVRTLQL